MFLNLFKSDFLPRYFKYKYSKKYEFLNRFNIKNNFLVINLVAHVVEISEFFIKKGCKVITYGPNRYCYKKLCKLMIHDNF